MKMKSCTRMKWKIISQSVMGVLSSFAFAPAERTDIHKQITLLMLQPQLWDDRSQESSGCRLAPVHYVETVKNFSFAFLASSLVSPWRASSLCFLSLYFTAPTSIIFFLSVPISTVPHMHFNVTPLVASRQPVNGRASAMELLEAKTPRAILVMEETTGAHNLMVMCPYKKTLSKVTVMTCKATQLMK